MRTVGARGLVGQVYTVEEGVLAKDDLGANIPLSGATNGFYVCNVRTNFVREVADVELLVYKSKAKFKNKPERPYQSIIFTIKNTTVTTQTTVTETITTPTGTQTVDRIVYETNAYNDFDTWFLDAVTKVSNNNDNRSTLDLIKTFTGSSALELRQGIQNTANYTAFTSATIASGD